MPVTDFDRLNTLTSDDEKHPRSMPFEQYFGEMDLTDEQIAERIAGAERFMEMMLAYFALVEFNGGIDDSNRDALTDFLVGRYRTEVLSMMFMDYQVEDHVDNFGPEITRSTEENMSDEDPYWLSEDRARFIAENESNELFEHEDYIEALQQGRTYKIWRTIMDGRQRPSHGEANGQRVPILEPFHINGYEMQYPRDDSHGAPPQEIVKCRCSMRYGGSGGDYRDILHELGYDTSE